MEEIVKTVKLATVLTRLNNVRLYLKNSRLSDMATVDGNNIHQWAMHAPPLQIVPYNGLNDAAPWKPT